MPPWKEFMDDDTIAKLGAYLETPGVEGANCEMSRVKKSRFLVASAGSHGSWLRGAGGRDVHDAEGEHLRVYLASGLRRRDGCASAGSTAGTSSR